QTDWSESRYEEIKTILSTFLNQTGFKSQSVSFIPCSGLEGGNLMVDKGKDIIKLLPWYQGPSLIEQLESLRIPKRLYECPMRCAIIDVFRGGFVAGINVIVRIETGFLSTGGKVMVLPSGEVATIKAIELDGERLEYAASGATVQLILQGIDPSYLSLGGVLCDPSQPAPMSRRFQAQLLVFDIKVPLTIGVPVELFAHHSTQIVRLSKLTALLSKVTGEVQKSNPR
ncbi:hypothetical protein BJ684DRAFT_12235, partial [Piptocephalis cylindrospora]